MATVDAYTLSDAARVRRTELSARHLAALRATRDAQEAADKKALEDAQRALAAVLDEIQTEYAGEAAADTGKAK